MTDLFGHNPPRPTKVGQANGEFLGHFALMSPFQRQNVTPADFPLANPEIVNANVALHGGPSQ